MSRRICQHRSWFGLLFFVSLFAFAVSGAAQKHRLMVQTAPGEVLRYDLQSHTVTTGEMTTPITNPEGGSKFTEAIHLVVTLKTLEAKISPEGEREERFLATFDQASRDSDSDALDLSAESAGDPFAAVAGRSVQYALAPDGRVENVEGLEEVFRSPALAQPVLQWLPQFSASTRVPGKPVSIGEKWKTERDVPNMPFADLVWRAESSYLRDEPCKLYAAAPAASSTDQAESASGKGSGSAQDAAAGANCAVILTRFQISRRGSASSDATPEDYVHNGLRTLGKWEGSGESLDSISLDRGVLIGSTQTSTQDVDFVIRGATTGSSIHRQAHSETHTEITLLQ